MRGSAGAAVLLLAVAGAAAGQEAATPPRPPVALTPVGPQPVLVLRQDALFDNSAFGRASRARIEAELRALAGENRRIEAALEAEERDLTARRAGLPAAEFRALSEAFNARVEGIRDAQEAKSRAITRSRDADRQRFVEQALPVLAEIMQAYGALVILDQKSVVLSFERIDITDQAVARIDAAIASGAPAGADGGGGGGGAEIPPAPGTAPAQGPDGAGRPAPPSPGQGGAAAPSGDAPAP